MWRRLWLPRIPSCPMIHGARVEDRSDAFAARGQESAKERRHENAHRKKAGHESQETSKGCESPATWTEESPARSIPTRCHLRRISNGTSLARRKHLCERESGARVRPWAISPHDYRLVTDCHSQVGDGADLARECVGRRPVHGPPISSRGTVFRRDFLASP
jgi:hypothetical protein